MSQQGQPIELTFEEILRRWRTRSENMRQQMGEGDEKVVSLTQPLLNLLVDEGAVSAKRLAEVTNLPLAEIEDSFAECRHQGCEFNEEGKLVGATLSLNPTPHKMMFGDTIRYAWCALDCLFLPALIGKIAQITSTCPVTQQPIHLTITPDGITHHQPDNLAVSVTIPGISCSTGNGAGQTGPQSQACSQMFFFVSEDVAETWLVDHPGVALLSLAEAYQLAYENWIVPNAL